MGGTRHSRVRPGALRCGSIDRRRPRRYGDRTASAAVGRTMTPDIAMALLPELALFALAVVVLLLGATRSYVGQVPRSEVPRGPAGWISLIGLLVVFGLTF